MSSWWQREITGDQQEYHLHKTHVSNSHFFANKKISTVSSQNAYFTPLLSSITGDTFILDTGYFTSYSYSKVQFFWKSSYRTFFFAALQKQIISYNVLGAGATVACKMAVLRLLLLLKWSASKSVMQTLPAVSVPSFNHKLMRKHKPEWELEIHTSLSGHTLLIIIMPGSKENQIDLSGLS